MHFLNKSRLLTVIALRVIVSAAIFFYQREKEDRFIVFFSGAGMKIPVSEIVNDFTDRAGIRVDVHFEGSAILYCLAYSFNIDPTRKWRKDNGVK